MGEVDRGIECVGYQAHDVTGEEHPELVLDHLVQVVRPTGAIGVVGVYVPGEALQPRAPRPDRRRPGDDGWTKVLLRPAA